MKASFYFVLWIGLYLIIDILQVPFLQNNAFIAAFFIVLIVQNVLNKSMVNDIKADNELSLLFFYEVVYTNDVRRYRRRLLGNLVLYAVFAIYFLFTFVWIVKTVKNGNWFDNIFEIVIFGGFGFFYAYRTLKLLEAYINSGRVSALKEMFPGIENTESYRQFEDRRNVGTFRDLVKSQPVPSAGYRISNMIFSIISILLGVWFIRTSIPFLVHFSSASFYPMIMAMYGALAIQAGIKDLSGSRP